MSLKSNQIKSNINDNDNDDDDDDDDDDYRYTYTYFDYYTYTRSTYIEYRIRMSNNVNKRPISCFIFISFLSLLLQILWHTKYWSLLYNNNIHYSSNNNDDGIGDTSFNLDKPYSRQVPIHRKQKRKRKRIKLIHVMNTYTITNNKNGSRKVQPFDQWSTIKSIERALKQNNNNIIPVTEDEDNSEIDFYLDVDFVCAIFESDRQYLQHLPCRKVILNRSTKTEYTTAESNGNDDEDYLRHFINIGRGNNPVVVKELPFLQDIIDSTISDYYKQQQNTSREDDEATAIADDDNDDDDDIDIDDFYIMLTNSDIGVTKDFYSKFLLPKLLVHKNSTTAPALALTLSINRLTIPMTKQLQDISDKYNNDDDNNNDDNNDELLLTIIDDTLQSNNGVLSHPGYDCFIIHSSILKKINLGNMFAGYPPWGSILHLILKIMTSSVSTSQSSESSSQSSDYINYKSSPQGTYHIGNDDSKWKNKAKSSSSSSSSLSSSLQQPQPQQEQKQRKYYYDTIIKNCPSKLIGNHPYTYLNTINCGLLWSMKTKNNNSTSTSTTNNSSTSTSTTNNSSTSTLTNTITSSNNNDYDNDGNNDNDNVDTDEIIRIPNFVQSGYEETYLKSKYYNSKSSK